MTVWLLAARLPGRHSGRVVVVDELLDVSQLLVEVLEVGPGVLVLTVPLVPLILHVNSCLYILKQQSVKFRDITQPPYCVLTLNPSLPL